MINLRQHQAELKSKLDRWRSDRPLKILAHVVPGGGKSWLPAIVRERFPSMKIAWFVPRVALREQAATALKKLGIELRESDGESNPSRGSAGFVATHQALMSDPKLYADEFKRHEYSQVMDELHHAKLNRKRERQPLSRALASIEGLCRVRLDMTGTLDTNEPAFIHGLEHKELAGGWRVDPEASADILIRYDRKMALAEKAIVPIKFHFHDGPVEYIRRGETVTRRLKDEGSKEEQADSLFTALKTEMAERLLWKGIEHWRCYGDQLILVGKDQGLTRTYHGWLAARGIEAGLAISEEEEKAKEAIRAYRKHELRVLATCQMCYEGLDAPPTTHVICLTAIRSKPWIEQMLARTWRSHPGKSCCWAFVPDDPDMRGVIDQIRMEDTEDIPAPTGDGPGGNGGGTRCVVPMSSGHKVTRIGYLDEEMAEEEINEKATAALAVLGLASTHSFRDDILKALANEHRIVHDEANDTTIKGREKRAKKNIWELCGATDSLRGVPPGTTQKELYRITGVLFDNAGLEELERVAQQCTAYCENFYAR